MIPAVEGLAADERGVLLGLLCAGLDARASGRLAGPGAERCGAALAALAALPDAARAVERASLVDWLAAPVPEGLAEVHPGWIRRVLETEPTALVRAVARGLPPAVARVVEEVLSARGEAREPREWTEGPGAAAARRSLFAALAPMPTGDGPGRARPLCALSHAALLEEIERLGAETLGRALAGAPDAALARAAAGVGEPLARVVLASAKAGPDAETRAAARVLVAEAPTEQGRGAARAVGLVALARALEPEGAAALAAVAQRLPPSIGDALLARATGAERAAGQEPR